LPMNRPTSAHRQKRSERSTSIGGCHDHELWINFPGMRRDFRALLRCNLGVLVCGTVAGSERPASVNQFCSVGLRWLDAEVETAADPAIRVSISRSARGGAAVCAVSMGLRQGRGGKHARSLIRTCQTSGRKAGERPSVPGTNRTTQRLNPSSVVRGSDELRGENVPDGTWRAARSRRNPVHGTHCHLAGTAEWPRFLRAGSRHSGTATAQRAILGARNQLAGHSPDGNRCGSVGIGSRFVALANRAAGKQRPAARGGISVIPPKSAP
jgi:hypothetical protein